MNKTMFEREIRKAAEKRFQKIYTEAIGAIDSNPILKKWTVIRFNEDVNLLHAFCQSSALFGDHYMSTKTNFDEVRKDMIDQFEKEEMEAALLKIKEVVTIPVDVYKPPVLKHVDKSFDDFVMRTLRRICATLDIPIELLDTLEERRKS
jgi:hypothetical protein